MYGLNTLLRASFMCVLATEALFCATAHGLVISQIYGGGGNSGTIYKNDFIEIFNDSAVTVDMSGYSVQYASASAGRSWQVTDLSGLLNPYLDPYHYFLVQEAIGAGGTTLLPTPDASGSLALSASSGKVALVKGTAPVASDCTDPLMLITDLVGYGTASCFEGLGAAPTLSNTSAAWRQEDGLQDSGDNAYDFAADLPVPRNRASPANVPSNITLSEPSSLMLILVGALACSPWLRRMGPLLKV